MKNLYCGSRDLGILWASIQTELLTYRRIKESDPWISLRFNIQQLMDGLDDGSGPTHIPLYQDGMMNQFTDCGWFDGASDLLCPSAEEACKSHFMNLEDWNRTSFIDSVVDRCQR